MAALTENTSIVTEFSGKYKVVALDIDGATGTTGTVTIQELTAIVSAVGQLREAPTAACANVRVTPNATTATNVLQVILYASDGVTACTQTATDVSIIVVGY